MTFDNKCRGKTLLKLSCVVMVTLLLLVNFAGAAPFAYIPNYDSNTTSVMDIANNNVTATVPVGINPNGVAVSPDGKKVYVANFFSNTTSVIDSTNNNVIATVPVGGWPFGVAVSPDGKKTYVQAVSKPF